MKYMRPLSDGKQTYRYENPRWIKVFVNRIVDDGYRNLSAHERAALHGLELLYALRGQAIPLDVKMLNSLLALPTKMATWTSLNHAGFVEFLDQPVATRAE